MNDSPQGNPSDRPAQDDMISALFAHMVMQQSNIAMMMLGKVPHPETGQTLHDLDAAKLFIDQLEMIEAKTNGNLSKEEAKLLQQSLMNLRMLFVEAVNATPPSTPDQVEPALPAADGLGDPKPSAPEESHKKFSKKY